MRKSRVALFLTGVLIAGMFGAASASSGSTDVTSLVKIPGLKALASVVRDDDGVAHIKAQNPHDRGHLDEGDLTAFLAAGFDRAQLLEVITGVAISTMANYAGNIAQPPLEQPFQAHAWNAALSR